MLGYYSVTRVDQELAAALVVAMQSGLLSSTEAMQVVDREIVQRDEPEAWLIDASLAKEQEEMRTVLLSVAGGHRLLSDIRAALEALDLALGLERLAPMDAALRVLNVAWGYGDWPEDLRSPLKELDVEWSLDDDGMSSPSSMQEALSRVLEASRGSRWRAVFERILA